MKTPTLTTPQPFVPTVRENPWTRDTSQDLRAVDATGIAPHGFARPRTESTKRQLLRQRKRESAASMIRDFDHDIQVDGLTDGSFSLIDLITATLERTGAAKLVVSSWTASNQSVEEFARLVDQGTVLSCRWLLDLSFQRRRPQVAAQIRDLFGVEAIRLLRIHAKFCLIENREWKVTLQASMNLCGNPRMENFQLSDDPDLYAFYVGAVDEIFRRQAANGKAKIRATMREG